MGKTDGKDCRAESEGYCEVKLAILGTGFIVKEGALEALKYVPEIEVAAIYARPSSREKADRLAAVYGISLVYTDYNKLLNNTEIDFVYIGLVNNVHYEYAKRAIMSGKHVIVEKPFASTAREVEELRALAFANKIYIFEAVPLLYMPNFRAVKELLPSIGQIRAVMANYSQYSSRYDKYLAGEVLPTFSPRNSAGSLYDINIYNINFIVALFGLPDEVDYTANIGFNGIDTSGIVTLSYQGFFAVALGAKDSDSPSFITVQGEKGWIRAIGTPNEFSALEIFRHGDVCPAKIEQNQYEHRMVHEFKSFAEIFHHGEYERMKQGLDVSVNVIKVAEKARKKAKIIFCSDEEQQVKC